MEKEDPNNYEFIVPAKLKELYEAKDYGRYAYVDEMRVCFITDNEITVGNFGSQGVMEIMNLLALPSMAIGKE